METNCHQLARNGELDLNDWFVGLRTENALLRFYGRNTFGGNVDAAHHLFSANVDGDAVSAAWNGWLDSVDCKGPAELGSFDR